jgi:hypothetical protein
MPRFAELLGRASPCGPFTVTDGAFRSIAWTVTVNVCCLRVVDPGARSFRSIVVVGSAGGAGSPGLRTFTATASK